MGEVGFAENKATQPSLAKAWAELGKRILVKNLFVKKNNLGIKITFKFILITPSRHLLTFACT